MYLLHRYSDRRYRFIHFAGDDSAVVTFSLFSQSVWYKFHWGYELLDVYEWTDAYFNIQCFF